MDTSRLSRSRAMAALGMLSFCSVALAADPGIITRRGADVRGEIDGAVQMTSDGDVQIAPGASISGEFLVLAERPARGRAGRAEKNESRSLSIKTTVNNRGGSAAVKGEIKAAEGFQLPHVHAPRAKSVGEQRVMSEEYVAGLDFNVVKDFTVNHRKARVTLPPNTYGHFTVSEGTLVLGVPGVRETLRYEFQKLDVQAGGRIEVMSPVVVAIANGAAWQGSLGERKSFWLDVRVAAGDVTLASGAEFNGHLSAPASLVTVARQARFSGGLVSDRLLVEEGAKLTQEAIAWSGTPGERLAPTGAHRALKLQREMPKLRAATKARYSPGVSYIDDVPYIMLAANGAPDDALKAAHEEHAAVFEAFRSAFMESGFAQARLVLVGSASAGGAPATRNLALSRAEFDAVLVELGTKSPAPENVPLVAADPALLERFMQRTIALSTPAARTR